MARETITVKCYPSVEAINKETQTKNAFGWELIGNQSVDTGRSYYQMLTFTRESTAISPKVRELNEEFDLLENVNDYSKLEQIIQNYQNKTYYQYRQQFLEEVEEVEKPKIANQKRLIFPLIGLIFFSILCIITLILFLSKKEFNNAGTPIFFGSVALIFLVSFISISKQENGLRGTAAKEATKKYQDYLEQIRIHRRALKEVLNARREEIIQEAKTLTSSY